MGRSQEKGDADCAPRGEQQEVAQRSGVRTLQVQRKRPRQQRVAGVGAKSPQLTPDGDAGVCGSNTDRQSRLRKTAGVCSEWEPVGFFCREKRDVRATYVSKEDN